MTEYDKSKLMTYFGILADILAGIPEDMTDKI